MATDHQNVVPLPLLEGGSIEDTLSGFAAQIDRDAHVGRRLERAVSVVVLEIRGWDGIRDALDSERAGLLLHRTVERVLDAAETLGPEEVSLEGHPTRPVVTARFAGDDHPLRAVAAAQAMRDAAGCLLHPSMADRFQGCAGVNSGTVVDAHVAGSGIAFSSNGTTRMFAERLQGFAGPGQVFVSEATYRAVARDLEVTPVGAVRTSPDGERSEAYCVHSLLRRVSDR